MKLALFALIGADVYQRIEDRRGAAAAISRTAILVYVPFDAGFNSQVGIGTGVLRQYAHGLPASQRKVVEPLIDAFFSDWAARSGMFRSRGGRV